MNSEWVTQGKMPRWTYCCDQVVQEGNDKVDQPITEDEGHQSRPFSVPYRNNELERRQIQDDEVKCHRVDEACGENLVVGLCDDASTVNPIGLEKNTYWVVSGPARRLYKILTM